ADLEAFPGEIIDQKPSLELVPPSADLFANALRRPIQNFSGIDTNEFQTIRNKGREDASSHFLTSVLLRLAGDKTDINTYGFYAINARLDSQLQAKASSTSKARAQSAQRLTKATAHAQPYIEM